MDKRGEILVESVIFIILNVLFLSILILFILKQGTGAIILETSSAKEIALLIDSAKPGMIMRINMGKAFDLAEKNGISSSEVVKFDKSYVKIHLSEKGGSQYHYFNNISINTHLDKEMYVMVFSK